MPKRNIPASELVPYEPGTVQWRYDKAIKDIERDGKFDPPAPVFQVGGHFFVKNSTNHVAAAIQEFEMDTIPCEDSDPPADVGNISSHLPEYLKRKGFKNLPMFSSDEERMAATQKLIKKDTEIDTGSLAKQLEAIRRKKAQDGKGE